MDFAASDMALLHPNKESGGRGVRRGRNLTKEIWAMLNMLLLNNIREDWRLGCWDVGMLGCCDVVML
jgi:hypothetical protein